MEYTENLNLKKPEEDDYYSVGDANANMEILDEVIADDIMPNLVKREIARFVTSGTWEVPEGVSEIDVYVVGGGMVEKGGCARLFRNIQVTAGDEIDYVIGAGSNSATEAGGATSFGSMAKVINDYSRLVPDRWDGYGYETNRISYVNSPWYNAINPYDGRMYGQWSDYDYPVTTAVMPKGVKPAGGTAVSGKYGEIGGNGVNGNSASPNGGKGGYGLVGGNGGNGYSSTPKGKGGDGGDGDMLGGDGGNSYNGVGSKGGNGIGYGAAGGHGDGGQGGNGGPGGGAAGLGSPSGTGGCGLIIIYA